MKRSLFGVLFVRQDAICAFYYKLLHPNNIRDIFNSHHNIYNSIITMIKCAIFNSIHKVDSISCLSQFENLGYIPFVNSH